MRFGRVRGTMTNRECRLCRVQQGHRQSMSAQILCKGRSSYNNQFVVPINGAIDMTRRYCYDLKLELRLHLGKDLRRR